MLFTPGYSWSTSHVVHPRIYLEYFSCCSFQDIAGVLLMLSTAGFSLSTSHVVQLYPGVNNMRSTSALSWSEQHEKYSSYILE
jgi:hypothetical protein